MRSAVAPRSWIWILSACLALVAGIQSVWAAPGDDPFGAMDDTPTSVDVPVVTVLSHDALKPGETGHLAVVYAVPPQSHIQLNDFFYVELAEGAPATLGKPIHPATIEFMDEPVFMGETKVFVPITLNKDAPSGPIELEVKAGYQACLEEPVFVCYAPDEKSSTVRLESGANRESSQNKAIFASLAAAKAAGGSSAHGSGDSDGSGGDGEAWLDQAESSEGDTDLAGRLEAALAKGSFLAFVLVFVGGFLTSFTPCVYPMIPITISYIGGSSKSKFGGFVLSLFFVLGIALMYSTLGLIAAMTGGLFGSAMQSTPVLVTVAAVFALMGASMLGAFDLALPSSMQTKLQSGPRTGPIGAVLMGMVTGIVASPCVGPVLVVLLTWVAQNSTPIYGFFLLFTFAVGLGMLFIVIGTFAGALNALPQAGEWMDTVKHVFGVILFGMAIYYLRSIIGPNLTWLLTGLLVLLTGTVYGAFRPVPEDAPIKLLFRKGLGIAMVLCGGFALLLGFAGMSGINFATAGTGAVAGGGGGAAEAHAGLDWVVNDDEAALAQALSEGKPVVIDFYADWCTACKELDHKTWVDDSVRAEAERFVAIKMDFTEKSDWAQSKYQEYGVSGLPTVIFLDSSGQEQERFFGFRDANSVLSSMRDVD